MLGCYIINSQASRKNPGSCGRSARSARVEEEMITTLAITIFIESVIIAGYALWRKKPLAHLLLSSILANLFTQFALWVTLNVFTDHYLITLFIVEICIWGIKGAILYLYRYNRLNPGEALFLSLVMNLASFGIGWFLPV